MNADAIIERLEKLETWWADLGDDQDVLVVRKSDLDAAIADIRGLLQSQQAVTDVTGEPVTVAEPVITYNDICYLSVVWNTEADLSQARDRRINNWLGEQIAIRKPTEADDAK